MVDSPSKDTSVSRLKSGVPSWTWSSSSRFIDVCSPKPRYFKALCIKSKFSFDIALNFVGDEIGRRLYRSCPFEREISGLDLQVAAAVLFQYMDRQLSSRGQGKPWEHEDARHPAMARNRGRAVEDIEWRQSFQRGRGDLFPGSRRDLKGDAVDIIVQRGAVVQLQPEEKRCAMRIDAFDLELHSAVAVLQEPDPLHVPVDLFAASSEIGRTYRHSAGFGPGGWIFSR